MIKIAVKKIVAAMGYEIRQAVKIDYRFVPRQEDKFKWLQALNIRTILDIGANTGQFASEFRSILPEAKIYSFEPLRECFDALAKNMEHVPQFQAFPFALGDEETEIQMNRNELSPSSSILAMADLHKKTYPFTANAFAERITVKRLDDVASHIDLWPNILIKMDVQGFEDRVILGGMNTIPKAKLVIVETSFERLYEGQPSFDKIYDLMKRMGFAYHGNFGQLLSPKDGNILQADAMFLKAGPNAKPTRGR